MRFSRGSSQPRNQTCISHVSCFGTWVLYHERHLGSSLIRSDYSEKSASQCQRNALGASRVSISDINKQYIKLKCSWSEARGMLGNMLNYSWELENTVSHFKARRGSNKKQFSRVIKCRRFTSKDA